MSGAASIGLDLGAGKCCVASVRAGAVKVLPNAYGDKTTPSFVAFTDSRSLVGRNARDQATFNAANTVYGVKTVLGRRFDKNQKRESFYSNYVGTKSERRPYSDEEEVTVLPYLPVFSSTVDGLLVFEVEYRNEKVRLRPEEITALLIAKMKSDAENHLRSEVTNAVITVPVNFGNAPRQATLDAALIAGLESVTLINSTTAAAIAYWDHRPREKDCVAVVDFGANSLNLSIVSMDNGALQVQEAFGSSTVGGNFIDMCMMQTVIKKFEDQHHQSFEESPKALMRIRTATEKLKDNLTLLSSSVIQVDSMSNDIDFTSTFTRREMEVACQNQLLNLANALHQLTQSESWTKVRTVVLVGGSTRIPAVEKLIAKTLGKSLDTSLNKDEAIACGAAIRADEFSGSTTRKVEEVFTRCISYDSVLESGRIFDSGACIPAERSFQMSNDIYEHPNGLRLYENIPTLVWKRFHHFELTTLRLRQLGLSTTTGGLLFAIDESGVLRIKLIVEGKTVDMPTRELSSDSDDMQAFLDRHKVFLDDISRMKDDEHAMDDLESFCVDQKEKLREKFGHDSAAFKLCEEILTWLEDTPEATKQQCSEKKRDLENKIDVEVYDKALPHEPQKFKSNHLDDAAYRPGDKVNLLDDAAHRCCDAIHSRSHVSHQAVDASHPIDHAAYNPAAHYPGYTIHRLGRAVASPTDKTIPQTSTRSAYTSSGNKEHYPSSEKRTSPQFSNELRQTYLLAATREPVPVHGSSNANAQQSSSSHVRPSACKNAGHEVYSSSRPMKGASLVDYEVGSSIKNSLMQGKQACNGTSGKEDHRRRRSEKITQPYPTDLCFQGLPSDLPHPNHSSDTVEHLTHRNRSDGSKNTARRVREQDSSIVNRNKRPRGNRRVKSEWGCCCCCS